MLDLAPIKCLKGSIIVSTPMLAGRLFEECVIYIYDHSPKWGAQGIVINRTTDLTVLDLLEKMELFCQDPQLDFPLYHGGPVEENGIAMVHTSEWFSSNTCPVTSDISISSDEFMIDKLVDGNAPANWLMSAGKCEWEPGEIEQEIAAGCWLCATASEEMLFSSKDNDSQWSIAIEYCTKQAVDSWI
jgi:putative transcriptional regulator